MANYYRDTVVDIPPHGASWSSPMQHTPITSLARTPCIYKVPDIRREKNEDDFTPRIVSIGPLHYGKPNYSDMETDKVKIMDIMIKETGKSFYYLLNEIGAYEDMVRTSYNVKVDLDSQTFVRMMLMDATFLIFAFHHNYAIEDKERHLFISLPKAVMIQQDLLLFENQLPSFLLNIVYNKFYGCENNNPTLLSQLLLRILPDYLRPKVGSTLHKRNLASFPAAHFVELLRLIEVSETLTERDITTTGSRLHPIYNAKKLHMSGVKIHGSPTHTFFDTDGGLLIKYVEISDIYLIIYKNIMALELCVFPNQQFVSDQFVLLAMLTSGGSEDEEILKRDTVIWNRLPNGKSASEVFRELTETIMSDTHPFSLRTLCMDANNFCDRPIARLRSSLANISLEVGVLFIGILTLIQTVCAVLSLMGVTLVRK